MRRFLNPLIGALVGTCIAWMVIPRLETLIHLSIPLARWFVVESIVVADARTGVSNEVALKRAINRPFSATWTVTLMRLTRDGFAHFCSRHGQNDYRPEAVLPPYTDIDWWMNVPANPTCGRLPPGRYVLNIVWRLRVPGLQGKEVRVQSNDFEVLP